MHAPADRVAIGLVGALVACVLSVAVTAQARHDVRGMVVEVDAASRTVVVSHDAIAGVMPAMTMAFEVRTARELNGVAAGSVIAFTLVLGREASSVKRRGEPSNPLIEAVRVVPYESVEQDPLTARRLRLLQDITGPPANPLRIGERVPDFTLIDQTAARVSLSQFRGRVVALNFVYTSCVLPQFCYRLANHFSVVQRRFAGRMGRDLVLLTVTFDPARDTPERLSEYAGQWKADPTVWRFLTGDAGAIATVGRTFGLDAFPDEGLISHSTRTVVIDRAGALAASIEGNKYTAGQLGDLLDAVLQR
jgi:protein SCO1